MDYEPIQYGQHNPAHYQFVGLEAINQFLTKFIEIQAIIAYVEQNHH